MCDKMVDLHEMREEIKDMLSACFEGKVTDSGAYVELLLNNGQRFSVTVQEA